VGHGIDYNLIINGRLTASCTAWQMIPKKPKIILCGLVVFGLAVLVCCKATQQQTKTENHKRKSFLKGPDSA
jgi:hypothetical protein